MVLAMGAAYSVRASGRWAFVVPNWATGTVVGIATLRESVSLVGMVGVVGIVASRVV